MLEMFFLITIRIYFYYNIHFFQYDFHSLAINVTDLFSEQKSGIRL